MVKIIVVGLLIAIQRFIFLFTMKDKSVRLRVSVRTRTCTHLPITFVKVTFTYCVWFYVQ